MTNEVEKWKDKAARNWQASENHLRNLNILIKKYDALETERSELVSRIAGYVCETERLEEEVSQLWTTEQILSKLCGVEADPLSNTVPYYRGGFKDACTEMRRLIEGGKG